MGYQSLRAQQAAKERHQVVSVLRCHSHQQGVGMGTDLIQPGWPGCLSDDAKNGNR